MICTSCGTSNDDTSVTCTQCGAPLTPPAQGMPQAPLPPQAGPPVPVPKSSRHPGLVIGIAVAAVIVLAAVATGAILVFGGSGSPDTVAQDSMNALLSGNLSSACHYLLPNEQPACTSSMPKAPSHGASISGHLSVAETRIQGNEALVSFVGKACIKFPANASPSRKPVTHCQSLSNPSAGMPPGAGSFQHALSNRAGVTAGDVIVALEKYNGHWYVDDRSFANTNGAG